MEIKRERYLRELVERMHNGMIKVITGIRRCGKSYLILRFSEIICQTKELMKHISLQLN